MKQQNWFAIVVLTWLSTQEEVLDMMLDLDKEEE
jgi:hypothetical protein